MTPQPLTYEEITALSKEEFLAYFDAGGDLSDFLRHAPRVDPEAPRLRHVAGIPVYDPDEVIEVTVRLPIGLVERLAQINWEDGCAGGIRTVAEAYFAAQDTPGRAA